MKTIYESLNAIQVKLNAPKDKKNNFGGYNYRSAESILEALKEHLAEEKCIVTIADEPVIVGDRYYIKATATFRNAEGESLTTTAYAREDEMKKGMDGAQVTGASSSYARKYALNGLFAIDDCKDPDTDEYRTQQNAAEDLDRKHRPEAAKSAEYKKKPEQKTEQKTEQKKPEAPKPTEQNQKAEHYTCEICGQVVTEFDMNGQTYSPDKIVYTSKKKFNKTLCMVCYMKEKENCR